MNLLPSQYVDLPAPAVPTTSYSNISNRGVIRHGMTKLTCANGMLGCDWERLYFGWDIEKFVRISEEITGRRITKNYLDVRCVRELDLKLFENRPLVHWRGAQAVSICTAESRSKVHLRHSLIQTFINTLRRNIQRHLLLQDGSRYVHPEDIGSDYIFVDNDQLTLRQQLSLNFRHRLQMRSQPSSLRQSLQIGY